MLRSGLVGESMMSGNYNRAYREPDEACAGRADNPFDHSAQARQSMPRRLRHDMDAMSEACKSEFLQPMDEDAAPHPDHCRDADNRQRRHQPGHGMHQSPPQRAGAGVTALSEVKADIVPLHDTADAAAAANSDRAQ